MKVPCRASTIFLCLTVVVVTLVLLQYERTKTGRYSTTEINHPLPSGIIAKDVCSNIPNYGSHASIRYMHVLEKYSDSQKVIIMAYVDNGYVDCAINLFVTSFARFNINNYVFISSDEESCLELAPFQINCEYLVKDLNTSNTRNKASTFDSPDFNAKTRAKVLYVRDALALGYTIFSIDLDIVFIQNAFPIMLRETNNHDIAIQMDNAAAEVYNSGFYLARPTSQSKCLFHLWCQKLEEPNARDQPTLNELLPGLRINGLVTIFQLSDLYKTGCQYWGKRTNIISYVDPFSTAVNDSSDIIVHNNCMKVKSIKIYRFKEKLLWRHDVNGYYSNTSAKYITYDNPLMGIKYQNKKDFKALKQIELQALENALSIAYILNRIVILPVFHCYGEKYNIFDKCTILQHNFDVFDNFFEYREHVFLHNPLTAVQIKQSSSRRLLISSNVNSNGGPESLIDTDLFVPKDKVEGATVDEITEWFGDMKDSVLNFYSMHNTFKGYPNQAKYNAITQKLSQLNTA